MTWNRLPELLIGLAAVVSLLAFAGAIYQVITTKISERQYKPPGRLVDVGGYRLHIHFSNAT